MSRNNHRDRKGKIAEDSAGIKVAKLIHLICDELRNI
jgi:hypothetical protein